MIVIFLFSNQASTDSSRLSNGFINNTVIKIYRLFDNDKSNDEIIEVFSHPIRKMAHFTIYLILGLLVYNLLREYNVNNLYICVLVCMFYACTDEIHQAFVVGRSCELMDVFIDTFGSYIGVLLLKKFWK